MLTFVPTPIGNLEDISLRALRHMEEAQVVLCEDTRVAKKLFSLLDQKNLLQLQKQERRYIAFHSHTSERFFEEHGELLSQLPVIYLSDAGMPSISDPGSVLVRYCQRRKIAYDVLPGSSAVLVAFVASGFGDKEFCFEGFLPHKGNDRGQRLAQLMESEQAVVLFESPQRVQKLLREITELDAQKKLFACKELTKLHQEYLFGSAEQVLQAVGLSEPKGEWCIVLGPSQNVRRDSLSLDEILQMDLPPKILAKIEARISGKSAKECYAERFSNKAEN